MKKDRDPIKFDPLSRALMERQAVDLSEKPKLNLIARVFHEDLVAEDEMAPEGTTKFFTSAKKQGEWGSFSKDRDILAVTMLSQASPNTWAPVVGARIVVTVAPSFVVLDGSTRGDGSTIALPARVFPIETALGQLLHCPIQKGADFRVEVQAPGYEGSLVRLVLHTMRADEV